MSNKANKAEKEARMRKLKKSMTISTVIIAASVVVVIAAVILSVVKVSANSKIIKERQNLFSGIDMTPALYLEMPSDEITAILGKPENTADGDTQGTEDRLYNGITAFGKEDSSLVVNVKDGKVKEYRVHIECGSTEESLEMYKKIGAFLDKVYKAKGQCGLAPDTDIDEGELSSSVWYMTEEYTVSTEYRTDGTGVTVRTSIERY